MQDFKVLRSGSGLKSGSPQGNQLYCAFGNHKLAATTLNFSLPAIKTCPNSTLCAGTCYARKAEIQYPSVLKCREQNRRTSLTPDFVGRMAVLIQRAVSKYKVDVIRIHESGDFYSQDYADKWEDITRMVHLFNPDVKFYAYTKSQYRPKTGVNIVESILPGGELNFGSNEYVIGLAKKYHATVCPYGKTKNHVVCGVDCKACLTKKYVVFVKH